MRPHVRYTLIGIVLGLGAPVGSLAWRLLTESHGGVLSTITFEWQTAGFYWAGNLPIGGTRYVLQEQSYF